MFFTKRYVAFDGLNFDGLAGKTSKFPTILASYFGWF